MHFLVITQLWWGIVLRSFNPFLNQGDKDARRNTDQ